MGKKYLPSPSNSLDETDQIGNSILTKLQTLNLVSIFLTVKMRRGPSCSLTEYKQFSMFNRHTLGNEQAKSLKDELAPVDKECSTQFPYWP